MTKTKMLHDAVARLDIEACLQLVESGADINSVNTNGVTALMIAVMPDENGDQNNLQLVLGCVQVLLSKGAKVEIVDVWGNRASHYASQLLDPEWKDNFGESAVAKWSDCDATIAQELVALLARTDSHGSTKEI